MNEVAWNENPHMPGAAEKRPPSLEAVLCLVAEHGTESAPAFRLE
jgi:hypothetical protein